MGNIYVINDKIFGDDEITPKTETVYYKKDGESFSEDEVDSFTSVSEALKYYKNRERYYLKELREHPERAVDEFYDKMIKRIRIIIEKLEEIEKYKLIYK